MKKTTLMVMMAMVIFTTSALSEIYTGPKIPNPGQEYLAGESGSLFDQHPDYRPDSTKPKPPIILAKSPWIGHQGKFRRT